MVLKKRFSWFDTKVTADSNLGLERNRYTYYHYIQALFDCQQTERALNAVATMKADGFGLDATAYAIVIKGLVANKELEMAWKVFEIIKEERENLVEQDPNTRNPQDSPFLRAMSSIMSGLVDLDLGKEADLLNEYTVNASLLSDTLSELGSSDSASSSGRSLTKAKLGIKRAFAMFRDLHASKEVRPNIYTYGIIIAGFAKFDTHRAFQIFQHMMADGIEPNDVIYTALLQGFAIARDAKGALAVFEDMRKREIEPNKITWHYLLRALLRAGVDKEYVDQVGTASRNGLPYKLHRYRDIKWELLAYVK